MGNIHLFARNLDGPYISNSRYVLYISRSTNPYGLSPMDHCYETIDQLCEFIAECEALKAPEVQALRTELDKRELFWAEISEEKARCMGFKV